MRPHENGGDRRAALMREEMTTLWESDGHGRLTRARATHRRPAPLIAVAATLEAIEVAVRHDVPATVESRIRTLVGDGCPTTLATAWEPAAASRIVTAVTGAHAPGAPQSGPSYLLDTSTPVPDHIDLRTSDDPHADRLRELIPVEDRELATPWAVAVVDGQVAAVCETARSTPTAVEAGVWTYPTFRRRGLATAATIRWSKLVAGRLAFYSTEWVNEGSQAVAGRAGGALIGQIWQVPAT